MKTLVVGVAALTVIACAEAASFADGCGFGPYLITPKQMTWQDAESYAVSVGGNLAAVSSAEEDAAIVALMAATHPNQDCWIGFTDEAIEGVWVWSNGEPVSYTNWRSGEPNNVDISPTGEDFAQGSATGWLDYASPLAYPGTPQESVILAYGVVELPGPATDPDLNNDGHVNGQDLALVLGFWGACGRGTCFGDANCDGVVDGEDLAIVLGAWTG